MNKYTTIGILICLQFSLFSQDEILSYVDQMPVYAGCDETKESFERKDCSDNTMYNFIYEYMNYPIEAKKEGVEGMVIISLVVEKDGALSGITAVKDIGSGCGEAAIETIKLMPNWVPGKLEGNLARVQVTIPVRFSSDMKTKKKSNKPLVAKSKRKKSEAVITKPQKSEAKVAKIAATAPAFLTYAEQMPAFPGCENMTDGLLRKHCSDSLMYAFVYQRLIYPSEAVEDGIEGMVVISFVVEVDGTISEIKAVRDIGAGCATAAEESLEEMPNWIPGVHEGNVVRVQLNIPIKFGIDLKERTRNNAPLAGGSKLKKYESKMDWAIVPEFGMAMGEFDNAPFFEGCGAMAGLEKQKCTEEKIKTFLAEKMIYPSLAWEKGYETTINVGFLVNSDGSVSNVKSYSENTSEAYNLPFKELQVEAENLMSQLPNWTPATHKGEASISYYFLPIEFDIIKYNRAQRIKQKKTAK